MNLKKFFKKRLKFFKSVISSIFDFERANNTAIDGVSLKFKNKTLKFQKKIKLTLVKIPVIFNFLSLGRKKIL